MADTPLLWTAGARKEAAEILQTLWVTGGADIRARLAEVIVAGPPESLIARLDPEKREVSRDRRVFDRLIVLERAGGPSLGPVLEREAARLRERYPLWRAAEGEEAHFATWMETRSGPDSDYGVDELRTLGDNALLKILINTHEKREGLLDAWRQLGNAAPRRVIALLEQLADQPHSPHDVWVHSLWAVREATKEPELRDSLLALLAGLRRNLFEEREISRAITDILAVAATADLLIDAERNFWVLFDLMASNLEGDTSNADVPEQSDWVSLAINRPMGRLAIAFFSALFARKLDAGARIPPDLRQRLDALVAPASRSHRLARVIAASRLSYLFAVDPDWAQANLLPNFDWELNEEEALAMWQGYAWQPRLDRKLWHELNRYFLPVFTSAHLRALGESSRSLAQMLVLVGIEFEHDELHRDEARNAVRAMSDELRSHALAWIVSILEQPEAPEVQRDRAPSESPTSNADALWTRKIALWLATVWPPEPALRTQATAEQFALIAITTRDRFPEAVAALAPYMVPSEAFHVVNRLAESAHPDKHPEATLALVDAVVESNIGWVDSELREILDRIQIARPQVAQRARFRVWDDRLRARQRS
jgi:hypothetical protein